MKLLRAGRFMFYVGAVCLVAAALLPFEIAEASEKEPPTEISLLFADDFSGERVGTFPRRLEFLGGQADVVERGGKRLLRATTNKTWFKIPLNDMLPEQFTIELDLQTPAGLNGVVITTAETKSNPGAYYEHPFLELGHRKGSGVASSKPKHGPTVLED
ncbi:MAG: hypothetical protein R3338_02530, partial [Thermoanaerobaculia bacterium]|nr:hypothetical protein [Thermoanaerobaculia bacterium]